MIFPIYRKITESHLVAKKRKLYTYFNFTFILVSKKIICIFYYYFSLQEGGKYGDLYVKALKNYGMLCIGLYRYRDTSSSFEASTKRYVITNPPIDFPLIPSDKVRTRYAGWLKVKSYIIVFYLPNLFIVVVAQICEGKIKNYKQLLWAPLKVPASLRGLDCIIRSTSNKCAPLFRAT